MKTKTLLRATILVIAFEWSIGTASAFYDASMGRWLNRDPIQEEGGNNLFEFVSNNSPNKIDPWGRAELWGYGNWCGYDRFGQNGAPIDAIDRACQQHDNCLATWRDALIPCKIKICNQIFCWQVLFAGCSQSPDPEACGKAKRDILAACALVMLVPPFNIIF